VPVIGCRVRIQCASLILYTRIVSSLDAVATLQHMCVCVCVYACMYLTSSQSPHQSQQRRHCPRVRVDIAQVLYALSCTTVHGDLVNPLRMCAYEVQHTILLVCDPCMYILVLWRCVDGEVLLYDHRRRLVRSCLNILDNTLLLLLLPLSTN
jgi:hypothetical protein